MIFKGPLREDLMTRGICFSDQQWSSEVLLYTLGISSFFVIGIVTSLYTNTAHSLKIKQKS